MSKENNAKLDGIFRTIGATNHCADEREQHDYYATDPEAIRRLLAAEGFRGPVWEPACGEGHISKVLIGAGYEVKSTDLIYRNFGEEKTLDFLQYSGAYDGDIITNPPYNKAQEFVERALDVITEGHKVAMLVRLPFLAGIRRKALYEQTPPSKILILSKRPKIGKNGIFKDGDRSAVDYCWIVWTKGYAGETKTDWI